MVDYLDSAGGAGYGVDASPAKDNQDASSVPATAAYEYKIDEPAAATNSAQKASG